MSAGGSQGDSPEPGDSPEEEGAVSGFASYRYRDFRFFVASRMFNAIAHHMVLVAVGYQVYDQTGDAMNLAYIGLASFAPAFGFALVTGYVADRFDRRLVVAVCYAVMTAAAAMFWLWTVDGSTEVWPVFIIMAVLGTGRAFYMPASNALLPNLVPPEVFPNAIAWHTSANKISQVTGPALGGIVYLYGADMVYALAAVLLAVGTVVIAMIHRQTQRSGKEPTNLKTLLAGVRYVFEKKVILGAITLDLFVVILSGVTALLPIFAKDILDVGAAGAGLLRSAMAAGAVLSALILTQVAPTRSVGKIIYISVFIFGAATLLFGVS